MISTTGICGTMLFAIIMVFHLSVQLLPATGIAVTSSAATIYNSTFISVEAWHAESLTNISWSLRGIGSAGTRDRVVVFWDSWRTDLLRFGSSVNRTTRYERANPYVLVVSIRGIACGLGTKDKGREREKHYFCARYIIIRAFASYSCSYGWVIFGRC